MIGVYAVLSAGSGRLWTRYLGFGSGRKFCKLMAVVEAQKTRPRTVNFLNRLSTEDKILMLKVIMKHSTVTQYDQVADCRVSMSGH